MKNINLTMIKMNNGSQALTDILMPEFCYAFFQTGKRIDIGLRM